MRAAPTVVAFKISIHHPEDTRVSEDNMVQGRYVFPFSQLRMTDVDRVGGKNASLGELLS